MQHPLELEIDSTAVMATARFYWPGHRLHHPEPVPPFPKPDPPKPPPKPFPDPPKPPIPPQPPNTAETSLRIKSHRSRI